MATVYEMAKSFKKKYPGTIAWRIKQHSKIIEKHLNPDEVVTYAFACQKNHYSYEVFTTYVVAITNKRIMLAQKRLLFGYLFVAVTPELYNDLSIRTGLLWGKVCIDTVKEVINLSNIANNAVPEVETKISEFMMEAKKEYIRQER